MSDRTIAQNTALISGASVLQKIISFVYFTLVASSIGAAGTGKYIAALSFTAIAVVFVDLGFTNVLIREVSKAKEKAQQYLSTTLAAKLLFGAVAYAAAVIIAKFSGWYDGETQHLIMLSAVTMLFDSIHASFYGMLRAYGTLKYEAIGIVGTQFVTLILGSIFLFSGFPLIFLILAFTIPSGLNALYAGIMLLRTQGIVPVIRFDRQSFLFFARIATPFALAGIFARVYGYIDSQLLFTLVGEEALGWYSIPNKISTAFLFIPAAFVAALYPRFSEFFAREPQRLAHLFFESIKYVLAIALPIAVGIGILSRDIVLSIYGSEYVHSIVPLQILMASMVWGFVFFIVGALLNACNKQVAQTVVVGIGMLVNVGLNIWAIPLFGVVGAAGASLITNVFLAILGYIIVPKNIAIPFGKMLQMLGKLALAAVGMGVLVWWVNLYVHFFIAILVGAVLYPIGLFATRTLAREEMTRIVTLFRH